MVDILCSNKPQLGIHALDYMECKPGISFYQYTLLTRQTDCLVILFRGTQFDSWSDDWFLTLKVFLSLKENNGIVFSNILELLLPNPQLLTTHGHHLMSLGTVNPSIHVVRAHTYCQVCCFMLILTVSSVLFSPLN